MFRLVDRITQSAIYEHKQMSSFFFDVNAALVGIY